MKVVGTAVAESEGKIEELTFHGKSNRCEGKSDRASF